MSRLIDQVRDVLANADRALWPDDILESVSATRHASRVRNALAMLASQGEAVESPEGVGWHRAGVVARPAANDRAPAYLISPETTPPAQGNQTTEKPMSTTTESAAPRVRELIMNLAADGQEWTAGDLAERLPTVPKKTIRNQIMRLERDGRLSRVRYGVYQLATAASTPIKVERKPAKTKGSGDATTKALSRHARTAREALDEYLDSLDDPVLSSLIASANAAERALTTYQQRSPK
ncbi:hypothetical protein SR882_10445 [Guyparkeria halophila]|uniref:HTH domain-containing protein n=1 Tax=Guyparkeria halophila TaxID=47960 RepID=A0ABZ0YVH7_9GAMM|nr:hypothetical protein [Guyparkeria halophila]WQH16169.1 hypothetical protein SR882_10445 [Guyparkeria halophila]